MSYDPTLLFDRILSSLDESPSKRLADLSQTLQVSRRTIEKAIRLSTGGTFRLLREEILLVQAKALFASQPTLPIKERATIYLAHMAFVCHLTYRRDRAAFSN